MRKSTTTAADKRRQRKKAMREKSQKEAKANERRRFAGAHEEHQEALRLAREVEDGSPEDAIGLLSSSARSKVLADEDLKSEVGAMLALLAGAVVRLASGGDEKSNDDDRDEGKSLIKISIAAKGDGVFNSVRLMGEEMQLPARCFGEAQPALLDAIFQCAMIDAARSAPDSKIARLRDWEVQLTALGYQIGTMSAFARGIADIPEGSE